MRSNTLSVCDQITEIERGVELLERRSELKSRLEKSKKLRVKVGFDPTAADLHLGHSILIRKLKTFQELGHVVIFLIGDFTGRIGDPSGRNTTRPVMDLEQIKINVKEIEDQIGLILDAEKVEKRFNSEWSVGLGIEDVMALTSYFTVSSLLKRDDFAKRFRKQESIQLLEFLYPMMQAYDSVMLKADVELGGTDQTFNLMMARELQRRMGQAPEIVLTMPLLEGLDGVEKMSKSLSNDIRLRDSAHEMVGKVMSINDDLMWRYYQLVLGTGELEIKKLKSSVAQGANPRDIKMNLAKAIAAQYHSTSQVKNAEAEFVARFRDGLRPKEIPLFELLVDEKGIMIANACYKSGLCQSTSEAHRIAQQGGLRVDEEKVESAKNMLSANKTYVLQLGKRKISKVRLVGSA